MQKFDTLLHIYLLSMLVYINDTSAFSGLS